MEDKYIAIEGPVYIAFDEEEPYCAQAPEGLTEQWLRDYFSGLDTLSTKLAKLLSEVETSRLGLMIKFQDQWISDSFYEDIDMPDYGYQSIRTFIEALISCAPKTEYNEMLWGTCESHVGQYPIALLAKRDLKDVKQFIRYMECCDLDHEVDHGSQFEEIVQAHGWTPETVALWISRNGKSHGQHGGESEWSTPQGDTIYDWIAKHASHQDFFLKAMAAHILAMLDWDERKRVQEHLFGVIDEDIMDIFFSQELFEKQGISQLTESIIELAKGEVAKHLTTGTTPAHWLDELL